MEIASHNDTIAKHVDVYWTETAGDDHDHFLADYLKLLSSTERQRAGSFHDAVVGRDYIVAHAMMNLALSKRTGVPPNAWEIGTSNRGKPAIVNDDKQDWPAFSLSHSRGFVVCATSSYDRLGIDTEAISRGGELWSIADRVLSPNERGAALGLSALESDSFIVKIWALKEAYSKAIGMGLALSFPDVSFKLTSETGAAHMEGASGRGWHFCTMNPVQSHVVALAVECQGFTPTIQYRHLRVLPPAL